ncbi:MAG: hypothetical protein ACP5MM_04600 [Acidithiobacillus sp.]|uniref:hypothetical protein n=1 Tax=Acidithiobacillus sp. TaxID=1872118 RepID=UPI003D05386F
MFRRQWALAVMIMVFSQTAPAATCEVDEYVTRAIGIEEPWLENAAYLFSQTANQAGGAWVLAPEMDLRLSDRVGLEIDPPAYVMNYPVGRGPAAFGPAGLGLKVPVPQRCNQLGRGRATIVTAEVEGQFWPAPQRNAIDGAGSSITAQVEWAQLWWPWFNQGELGYTQRVGTGVTSGGFVNTSLGRALDATTAIQVELELDDQLIRGDEKRGLEGSVMPQVAYRPGPQWLLAIGEEFAVRENDWHPQISTMLMAEREF